MIHRSVTVSFRLSQAEETEAKEAMWTTHYRQWSKYLRWLIRQHALAAEVRRDPLVSKKKSP